MPLKITKVNYMDLGLVKKGLLRITNTNKKGENKMITIEHIKEINKRMAKKLGEKGKFYIKVNGIGNVFFTPKPINGDLDLDEFEDYFLGKVKDNAKFTNEFFSVNIGYLINK